MDPFTLAFNEIDNRSLEVAAGGKGGSLARLHRAGYPVPDGFVILPAAFSEEQLLASAWEQVKDRLAQLRQGRGDRVSFAVRSSAYSEDSAQASFAGEFTTVLDVSETAAIQQAILAVSRSRQNERVRAYSEAQGVEGQQEMAVVVQEMVPAVLSGVLFTSDPISGSHSYMTGNYVDGLGERLVSGETSGESFRLQRPSGKYEGPLPLKRYGRRLYRIARRLEDELGGAQDIEFAVANGSVHLLQTRPITTLRGYNLANDQWNDSLRGDYLWANTNFGEALPEVMTPFTWSIFQIYFEEAFPFSFPGNHPLAGNIGGRFYLNLSLFASMVAALKLDPRKAMQEDETFGRLPDEVELPILPFSFAEGVRFILPLVIKARRRVNRLKADILPFLAEAQVATEQLRAQIKEAGSAAELVVLWRDSLEPGVRRASQAIFASMSQLQNTSGKLRRDLTRLVGEAEAGTLLTAVNQGHGNLESLGPLLGLAAVAKGSMSRQVYIERYGHRGPHEAELSEPRPAEDPTWIDGQLTHMHKSIEQGEVDIAVLLTRQQAEHDAAWNHLESQHPRQARKMRQRLDQGAEHSRIRESVRSEATRRLWAGREFALRAGELTGLGSDSFFLSWRELLALLGGDESVRAYIARRRDAYQKFRALGPYPSTIRGRFDPFLWAKDPDQRRDIFDATQDLTKRKAEDTSTINGFAGAAGIVEGRVRRLDSPDEGDQLLSGEILVANTTNIGWTPLFPRAAAIVTDIGAPLSHAAIVARELGVPAVVGCGTATMRLQTGDRVRVNGSRGTVEILPALKATGEPVKPHQ